MTLQDKQQATEPEIAKLKSALLRHAEELGRSGRNVEALSILSDHPQLWAEKTFVLELAYEEYLQRRASTERFDTKSFCERFSPVRSALSRLLALHQLVEHNPTLFTKSSSTWPIVGETFAGFRLLEELGRGAFSRVFSASEESLGGRKVSLKISKNAFREAAILGTLEHPHIVPVLSVRRDEASGWSAIAMPYLGRHTLEDLKDGLITPTSRGLAIHREADRTRSRVAATTVNRIGLQLALALEAAHRAGVIHGDLKPSNVLIDDRGDARLLDFNLSTSFGGDCPEHGGTLPYMAPEQLDHLAGGNQTVLRNPQTDIFSLGLLLQELLFGTHPYAADYHAFCYAPLSEICRELRVRQASRLPGACPPGIDKATNRLLTRCLATDPDLRISSVSQLIKHFRRRLSLSSRAIALVSRHPWYAAATASGLAAALSASLVWMATLPPESERLYVRGVHCLRDDDIPDGVTHLTRSIALNPNASKSRFALAWAYQERRDFSLALAEYEEIRRRHDDPLAVAGISYCHGELGNQPVAVAAGQDAIKRGVASAAVLNNTGVSLMRGGRHEDAIEMLQLAAEQEPHSPIILRNVAYCLWQQSVRLQKEASPAAMRAIDNAISSDPAVISNYVLAARILAWNSRETAKLEAASNYLVRAARLGWDRRTLSDDPFISILATRPEILAIPLPSGEQSVAPEPRPYLPPLSQEEL